MQMYNSRIVVHHRHNYVKFDFTQRERATEQKRTRERGRKVEEQENLHRWMMVSFSDGMSYASNVMECLIQERRSRSMSVFIIRVACRTISHCTVH